MKNVVCELLSLVLIVTICSAIEDSYLDVTCNEASDCYVLDDSFGLALSCAYDVHKCSCSNTFRSDFHLKWDNNQCLMSKYGPCGEKGKLIVGCQDGFTCINNQCRDRSDTKAVKLAPFVFQDSNCSNGCRFGDILDLSCSYASNQCECRKEYIADGRDSGWDIRNYDGDNDCSVGKFGPCGIENGIKIDCHGDGISCVDGNCLNPDHLISDAGEDCEYTKNCKDELLCSSGVCIEPFSLPEFKYCRGSNECEKGLQCRSKGPWSGSFCTKAETSNQ